MSRIRSKNTEPELAMRRLLRVAGLHFRGHVARLPGTPDFILLGTNIVLEVNGEFWHGKEFSRWRDSLSPVWREKIERNMARDRRNRRILAKGGYCVLSFWGRDVLRNPERCLTRIEGAIRKGRGA